MRHRDDRHVDARECAELVCVHPACVHDDLGLDVAAVRLDAAHPAPLEAHARHAGARVHLGAAAPGALRERERELARVDVAVRRQVGGAQDAFRRHRREELPRLLGRDELEGQPERLRPAGLARDLLHALLRRRKAQGADLLPARLQPDLVLERAIEIDRAHHHLRERERAPELSDEAGGMERRAARQLRPLDEDDVVPAEPSEPVEDRAAAHPAADDDSPRTISHGATLIPARRRRGPSIAAGGPRSGRPQIPRSSALRPLDRTGPLT